MATTRHFGRWIFSIWISGSEDEIFDYLTSGSQELGAQKLSCPELLCYFQLLSNLYWFIYFVVGFSSILKLTWCFAFVVWKSRDAFLGGSQNSKARKTLLKLWVMHLNSPEYFKGHSSCMTGFVLPKIPQIENPECCVAVMTFNYCILI